MRDMRDITARRRPLLAAFSLLTSIVPPCLPVQASPSSAFTIQAPPSFVTLSSKSPDSATIFSSGNFATGTTLSVSRIDRSKLGLDGSSSKRVDEALAAYRDRQTSPGAAKSRIISSTLSDDGGRLEFELLLSLVGDVSSDSQLADPKLTRHTLAVALAPNADELLVLWAGATQDRWDAEDGLLLRTSASSFKLNSLDPPTQ